MLERGFLKFFEFFCYFFWNFLAGVEYERNSGLKFFSPLLGLSHPVLAKNIAGKRFFKFFEFFCYFFPNFIVGVQYQRNSGLKYFFPFPGLSHPVLDRNIAWRGFLVFWIFLLFILEFSCRGRVWTEFGNNFFSPFLGLSHAVLLGTNTRKRFFNFFAISFGIFLPGSNMNGIRA